VIRGVVRNEYFGNMASTGERRGMEITYATQNLVCCSRKNVKLETSVKKKKKKSQNSEPPP
jgi:hypothetical protein